ncbi:MAG: 50S ribosomal protein L13 [Candidatus Doudnabacteria bacterium]|nr:50S ribosomal protein L13 [Candidatus Doudnabacteria bacterium]
MKSQSITLPKTVVRKWHEVDVSKQPLGRVSTQIANLLRGKGKRDFTPNMDMGDFVVAINAGHLKFTGRKVDQKLYFRHSGYLGGIKQTALKDLLPKSPEEVLKKAVFSMLDDVRFRKAMMARLKISKDDKHNYKIDNN